MAKEVVVAQDLTLAEKDVEFDYAPFGIIGLETVVGIVLTVLARKGALSLSEAVARFSTNPALILGLSNKGHLGVGTSADLTVLDIKREWRVDISGFSSKSRNSPFDSWHLRGMPVLTLVGGKVVWEAQ